MTVGIERERLNVKTSTPPALSAWSRPGGKSAQAPPWQNLGFRALHRAIALNELTVLEVDRGGFSRTEKGLPNALEKALEIHALRWTGF